MRQQFPSILLACATSLALSNYIVLYYNYWYFAGSYWPRLVLLCCLLAPLYWLMLQSTWSGLWRTLAVYWLLLTGLFMLAGHSPDLARLSFSSVLNLEAPMIWLPVAWLAGYALLQSRRSGAATREQRRSEQRALALRASLRRKRGRNTAQPATAGAVIEFPLGDQERNNERHPAQGHLDQTWPEEEAMHKIDQTALETQPHEDEAASGRPEQEDVARFKLLELLLPLALCIGMLLPQAAAAEGVDSTEPWTRPDRHNELKDETLRFNPQAPGLSAAYPAPLTGRARQTFYIVIDNKSDGAVRIRDHEGTWHTLGRVLSPVRKLNPAGFTASGWGEPGTLIATAVNALHLKTRHDYKTGKSTVFSLLPIEFAEFDPKNYLSYFNATASLVTDIPAGSGIFGGQWAPLIGSRVYIGAAGWDWDGSTVEHGGRRLPTGAVPLAEDYSPAEGDVFVIAVARHKYNPEWIEFENRFGGIIWVKELGLDAYPVGQVLKPVAGAGRFQGSLYAPPGRIRANHPGVLCISTSPDGAVGGFQIIPRDHSMSSEMTAARTKTQWMVVGPLWAFDPSWEGIPPLFTDYFYPAYVPLSGKLKDGTEVSGADVFLDRFTVRARYSDSADPAQYELLRPTAPLTFEALKDMTHLRIYFPRE